MRSNGIPSARRRRCGARSRRTPALRRTRRTGPPFRPRSGPARRGRTGNAEAIRASWRALQRRRPRDSLRVRRERAPPMPRAVRARARSPARHRRAAWAARRRDAARPGPRARRLCIDRRDRPANGRQLGGEAAEQARQVSRGRARHLERGGLHAIQTKSGQGPGKGTRESRSPGDRREVGELVGAQRLIRHLRGQRLDDDPGDRRGPGFGGLPCRRAAANCASVMRWTPSSAPSHAARAHSSAAARPAPITSSSPHRAQVRMNRSTGSRNAW